MGVTITTTPTAVQRFAVLAIKRDIALGALLSTSPRDFERVLAAAASGFVPGREYSERDVNDILRTFLGSAGAMLATDHVELRRWLVDFRVLERDGFGRAYTIGNPADGIAAAAREFAGVDLAALAREAREADVARRAERKARWHARSGSAGG
jgi:hypothetical protein